MPLSGTAIIDGAYEREVGVDVSIRWVCVALSMAALAALVACADAAPEPAPFSASVSASMSPAPGTPAAGRSPLRGTRWETATGFRCPAPDQHVVVDQVGYGDLTGDGEI